MGGGGFLRAYAVGFPGGSVPLIIPWGTAPTPTHVHADLLGKWLKGLRIPQLDWGCSDSPTLQIGKQRSEQLPKHFLQSSLLISGHGLSWKWTRHIPCPGT